MNRAFILSVLSLSLCASGCGRSRRTGAAGGRQSLAQVTPTLAQLILADTGPEVRMTPPGTELGRRGH